LAGTKQRFSGFSHPRQCSDDVLRMLVILAIRATTGRFSLSTTALALMDLNVSGASCMDQFTI
jgi:hypothetical protein